jgi:hypothetical protein
MRILTYYRCTCIFLGALLAAVSFLSCNDLDSINPYDPLKNPLDPKYPDRYPVDIFNAQDQSIGHIGPWCIKGIPIDTVISYSVIKSCSTKARDKNGFVPEKTDNVLQINFNVNIIGKEHTFGGISVQLMDQFNQEFNLFRLNMGYLTFKVKADAPINMGVALKGAKEGDPSSALETSPKRLLWNNQDINDYSWKPDVMKGKEYRMDTTWQEVRIPINDFLYHLERDEETKIVANLGKIDISRLMFITFAFGFDEFTNNGGIMKDSIYITDIAFERGVSSYAYPEFQIDQFTPPADTGQIYFVINRPEKVSDLYIYLQWGNDFKYRGILDDIHYSGTVVRLLHLNTDQYPIKIVTTGTIISTGTTEPSQCSSLNYQILHLGGSL